MNGFQSSIKTWFASRFFGWKRGRMLRTSDLANVAFLSIVPVRKPFPRGMNGTNPIPRSSCDIEKLLCSSFLNYLNPSMRLFN